MHLARIPPQAIDAEEAVLGAILLEKDAFEEVSEFLKPECFYLEKNEIIFRAMTALSGKNSPIDMVTVVHELKRMEELESIGGASHIAKLTRDVISAANITDHARIVFQKYHLRELIRISGEVINEAYQEDVDNFELHDAAERSLSALSMSHITGGMKHMSDVVKDTVLKIEAWRAEGSNITGVPSGFSELDNATRGWQPGDFIVIAARPSVGKTAFLLELAKNAGKKTTVGIWSLEMKSVFLGLRMVAAQSGINLQDIQIGNLSDTEWNKLLNEDAPALAKLKIQFEERSHITLKSLSRKARMMKKKDKLGLIMIDYLQLMSGDDVKGNREQEISKISRGLKNLALELDIPIIALSQLSREYGAKNVSWEYGPPLNAVRESGAIEQDADLVIMLWGATDEEIDKDPRLIHRRKVKIAKQRNGVLVTEEFEFKKETQIFRSVNDNIDFSPPKSFYEVEKDNPF